MRDGWPLFLLVSTAWLALFYALFGWQFALLTYAIPFGGAWCACVLSWKLF